MTDLDLKVKVTTDGTGKLDNLGGKLGGLAKGAGIAVGILGGVGIAAGAAFAGMASEAEEAQAKLESIFKNTGAAAFTSIDALNKHAEALAKSTTFDDDAVKGAQATLLKFGNITGEAFTEATEASADLAAFMGTDIVDASNLLGKALAVPEAAAGKLAKQGIILTEAQKAQIDAFTAAGDTAAAQGVILEAVGATYGTVAEDMAATSQGQMAQAMNALGEAGESLGVLLLPIFTAIAQGLKGLADFVVANMPVIQSVIGGVMSFISGIFGKASGAANGLQQIFGILVGWVKANLPTIQAVAGQVFGAIANVIKVVGPVILELAKVILPILGTAAGILFKALDLAFKGIGGAFEALGNVFETVSGVITGVVRGVVGAFKAIYNGFARFWNSIDLDFPSLDIPFFGKIGGFSIGLPDIPMLAEGGIVSSPTLAILGEKSPEAVVPLDRLGGPGTVINVTVQGHEREALEDLIAQAIGRVQWTQGAEALDAGA